MLSFYIILLNRKNLLNNLHRLHLNSSHLQKGYKFSF
jgi:hypothetical protein